MSQHITYQTRGSSVFPRFLKRPIGRSDKGLTLMECVVAIAIIALTGAMIGPPLVLAAATRIQNRRAEQATQIAQGEIDRVRALVTLNDHSRANLPAVTAQANLDNEGAPIANFALLKSVNAGCGSLYDGSQIPINQALRIDLDGDCEEDFLLQSFRDNGSFSTVETNRGNDGRPYTFNVMVRVYSARAAQNYNALATAPASLGFTSGEGDQSTQPLAVVTSQMSWSDNDGSLFCYHSTNNNCDD